MRLPMEASRWRRAVSLGFIFSLLWTDLGVARAAPLCPPARLSTFKTQTLPARPEFYFGGKSATPSFTANVFPLLRPAVKSPILRRSFLIGGVMSFIARSSEARTVSQELPLKQLDAPSAQERAMARHALHLSAREPEAILSQRKTLDYRHRAGAILKIMATSDLQVTAPRMAHLLFQGREPFAITLFDTALKLGRRRAGKKQTLADGAQRYLSPGTDLIRNASAVAQEFLRDLQPRLRGANAVPRWRNDFLFTTMFIASVLIVQKTMAPWTVDELTALMREIIENTEVDPEFDRAHEDGFQVGEASLQEPSLAPQLASAARYEGRVWLSAHVKELEKKETTPEVQAIIAFVTDVFGIMAVQKAGWLSSGTAPLLVRPESSVLNNREPLLLNALLIKGVDWGHLWTAIREHLPELTSGTSFESFTRQVLSEAGISVDEKVAAAGVGVAIGLDQTWRALRPVRSAPQAVGGLTPDQIEQRLRAMEQSLREILNGHPSMNTVFSDSPRQSA